MKKRLFPLAALALAFVACDQNDDLVVDNTKDTPITILSAGVADLSTRAIIEGQLIGAVDENATMSVFVTGGSDAKYNANNVTWIHNGTDWRAESPTLFEGTNSNQEICALSPYREDATLEDGVTITADGVTDYLVAASTPVTSNRVSLTMTHALTKLVLNATLGTELEGETITEVKVVNLYASGTLNVSDNSWSNLGEADAGLVMSNNEILVIPMASCESFPIVITTSAGKIFQTDISLASVDNKLEAGTQYTINLKVGPDKVGLGGITTASWGTPTEGGQLETF